MYKLNKNSITRLLDGACIPLAEGNTDYSEYLAWVAKGNIPDPADPIPAPTYVELRAAAYPSIGDQMDALWKGGNEAEAMKAKVMDVKKKYPKP